MVQITIGIKKVGELKSMLNPYFQFIFKVPDPYPASSGGRPSLGSWYPLVHCSSSILQSIQIIIFTVYDTTNLSFD